MSVQLKVWALHVQLVGRFVRRFSASHNSCVLYASTPGDLLSYPRRVDFSSLPYFYQAVLSAWVAVDGGFFALADTLVVASSSVRTPVSSVSTKSTYFWSSTAVSQLVLEALVVCSALSTGP